ncbi:MAG: quinoprotein dehydrogenase-associated SoxYZ-like carrier [Neptuniibacter sp.]
MNYYTVTLMFIVWIMPFSATAIETEDPFNSGMWDYVKNKYIGNAPYQFNSSILVSGPEFAEDSSQVPISIDATKFNGGTIKKIQVFVDLNPISHVLSFEPGEEIQPKLSTKIKLQQSSPIRVAVLDAKGTWHVSGTFIRTSGGGCTTPPEVDNSLSLTNLLEMKSRIITDNQLTRIKLKTYHPMETGLRMGTHKFHMNRLQLIDQDGKIVAKMKITSAVSQDPSFSFSAVNNEKSFQVKIFDSRGNSSTTQL